MKNLIKAQEYLYKHKQNIIEISSITFTLYLIGNCLPINLFFVLLLTKAYQRDIDNNIPKTFLIICREYYDKFINYAEEISKKRYQSKKTESDTKSDDNQLNNKLDNNKPDNDKSDDNKSDYNQLDNKLNDYKLDDDKSNDDKLDNDKSNDDKLHDNKSDYNLLDNKLNDDKSSNLDIDSDFSFNKIRQKLDDYMNNKINLSSIDSNKIY